MTNKPNTDNSWEKLISKVQSEGKAYTRVATIEDIMEMPMVKDYIRSRFVERSALRRKIEGCMYTQEQIENQPVLAMQDEMIAENRGIYRILSLLDEEQKI